MPDGRLRNVLLVISSVLLLAGVVAAVAQDGSPTSSTSAVRSADGARSEDTTTTTAAAEGEVSPGEETTTTTGPSAGGANPTAPPSPGPAAKELAANADPPPNRPPRAGAYRVRATFDGEVRELRATVEDRGTDGPTVKQLITLETDEGTIVNDFEWRPDGAYATKSKLTFGSVTADCDWSPDFLQARLPIRRGEEFTAESSCSTSVFGQPATIKATTRGKVVDAKRVQVAAGTFDVWVVEGSGTLTFTSSSFTVTQEETSTAWYAPEIGTNVREWGTTKASAGQRNEERQFEMELVSRPV